MLHRGNAGSFLAEVAFLPSCVWNIRVVAPGDPGGLKPPPKARPAPRLAKLIKLIVQVLEEVLHFARGEFFFCRVTAADQLLFQRIQRLNNSVLARENTGIVASRAVSVIQALPVGAVARQ